MIKEYEQELFEVVGYDKEVADAIVRPNITYWKDAWRRLRKNKVAIFSMVTLLVIGLSCILIPILSRVDYTGQNVAMTHLKPGSQHWFGTDELGRDVFVRLWMGGRVSILIGLLGAVVSLVFGTLYGGISGYFGGLIDDIMMRIVEVIVGIPYMIVVILVSISLGKGLPSLIIALCITSWTGLARLVRGQVLQLKENEYVLASKALGASPMRIILKHLLPNTMSVIIVNTTFQIPGFMFAEAFLSFIGLGVQPPYTSWGAMAALGQQQMSYYPHELLFPAVAISLTMLTFNLLGDGLRDALDPKLRQ
ncbi:oligopeptide ABC transporter permease [Ruminiclostridium cellobioparum subsp. termitidis CT1112]|jgi:oligopeptide transport system permease protein|uniref:Oligopeptide ABC transporter permease n=1 Tax=Ruminiclostridium cellobioparum subsp. termitidis CT1112 TaxID=1195236 RepID=S0FPW0_RUMCE|nr:oligopeptide ABC transporter permease [Ruminiclostridium cellobioparum subsp. termitidis CT1112]